MYRETYVNTMPNRSSMSRPCPYCWLNLSRNSHIARLMQAFKSNWKLKGNCCLKLNYWNVLLYNPTSCPSPQVDQISHVVPCSRDEASSLESQTTNYTPPFAHVSYVQAKVPRWFARDFCRNDPHWFYELQNFNYTLKIVKFTSKSTQHLPGMESPIGIIVSIMITISISIPIPTTFRFCCLRFLRFGRFLSCSAQKYVRPPTLYRIGKRNVHIKLQTILHSTWPPAHNYLGQGRC